MWVFILYFCIVNAAYPPSTGVLSDAFTFDYFGYRPEDVKTLIFLGDSPSDPISIHSVDGNRGINGTFLSYIENSHFFGCVGRSQGGALLTIAKTYVSNSNFTLCNALLRGGALYFVKDGFSTRNTFNSCFSGTNGGAITGDLGVINSCCE